MSRVGREFDCEINAVRTAIRRTPFRIPFSASAHSRQGKKRLFTPKVLKFSFLELARSDCIDSFTSRSYSTTQSWWIKTCKRQPYSSIPDLVVSPRRGDQANTYTHVAKTRCSRRRRLQSPLDPQVQRLGLHSSWKRRGGAVNRLVPGATLGLRCRRATTRLVRGAFASSCAALPSASQPSTPSY